MSPADLPVKTLGEGLQVDVGCIHVPEEFRAGRFRDVTRRHGDGPDTVFVTGAGGVDRVFQEDHRVVVGKGDATAAAGDGGSRDVAWRGVLLQTVEIT